MKRQMRCSAPGDRAVRRRPAGWFAAGLLTVGLLCGGPVRAGNRSSYQRGFTGFRVFVDCSPDDMGSNVNYGRMMRRCVERGAASVAKNASRLKKAYRHFADGLHPYTLARPFLDRNRSRHGPSAPEAGPVPFFDSIGVTLHLKGAPSGAMAEKIRFDFLLAQLHAGGVVTRKIVGARSCGPGRKTAWLRSYLAEPLRFHDMSELLKLARCRRAVEQAARGKPALLPRAAKGGRASPGRPDPAAERELRRAKIHAGILAAWSRNRPYPRAVYRQLGRLQARFVPYTVKLMIRMLPAGRFNREMRRIRSFVRARQPDVLKGDGNLRMWLDLGKKQAGRGKRP